MILHVIVAFHFVMLITLGNLVPEAAYTVALNTVLKFVFQCTVSSPVKEKNV